MAPQTSDLVIQRPGLAPADPGLSRAYQPIETCCESAKMSDLRKAEIARPKWLFASVKRNIGSICQPLGVSLRRQIG
jgi:hypothetical protein